jgi:hypothetical protein
MSSELSVSFDESAAILNDISASKERLFKAYATAVNLGLPQKDRDTIREELERLNDLAKRLQKTTQTIYEKMQKPASGGGKKRKTKSKRKSTKKSTKSKRKLTKSKK